MTEFIYQLGEFFTWTFGVLPTLGNLPNLFFGLIISGYFVYWLGQMFKHHRAGEL